LHNLTVFSDRGPVEMGRTLPPPHVRTQYGESLDRY
jgi:hypothetical protein